MLKRAGMLLSITYVGYKTLSDTIELTTEHTKKITDWNGQHYSVMQ
jgi:hypothetical protein